MLGGCASSWARAGGICGTAAPGVRRDSDGRLRGHRPGFDALAAEMIARLGGQPQQDNRSERLEDRAIGARLRRGRSPGHRLGRGVQVEVNVIMARRLSEMASKVVWALIDIPVQELAQHPAGVGAVGKVDVQMNILRLVGRHHAASCSLTLVAVSQAAARMADTARSIIGVRNGRPATHSVAQ